MYSVLFEKVIYPLIEARKPKGERKLPYLRFLCKTQWWSLEQLKELQLKRLHSLLSHAYSNVPYYHKIFNKLGLTPDSIKTVNDLIRLPILTKADVRNNIDDMIAKNYKKKDLFLNSTGGSTGEPLHFYTDRIAGSWNMAAAYRAWEWADYKIGDKMAYIWGAPQDISLHSSLKGKISDVLFRLKMLDAFNITQDTLQKFIREMRKFRPKVINAYASAAYIVARYLLEKGIEDIRPKAVLTTAEMLYDEQRETIEKAFSCPIYDYYSGRDTTLQATECSHHSGYHMSVETTVVEFIRNGQPVAPGELGEIILTDLTNYATPFIRYRIGDLGLPSNKRCPCGRGLPLMKKVIGRVTDFMITPDGACIHGEFFTHLFYETNGIVQFQLTQNRYNKLLLKIVKGDRYDKNELEALLVKMKKRCGSDTMIDVKFVNYIPVSKSGKRIFVRNEMKQFGLMGDEKQ